MSIETKRTELEIIRVSAAKAELEFKILEREEDIARIRTAVQVQDDKINELREKLAQMQSQ